MFTQQQIETIRQRVQAVTGITLPWSVQVKCSPGLKVEWQPGSAAIGAEDVNALARGFFVLSRSVREGKPSGSVTQRRHFESCGVMADMSRNAVMKVEAVKRYIDHLACLGMNMLMLYTEDTFEVPEYPAFGYLRGGYSQADLREIDDYAHGMGVELVPCIQTLAHLAQFLQWKDAAHLRDLPDVLLIDDEETYRFIEAEIRSVSSCVRSRRIHIGMDEAHGVGLGKYYAKHGPTDRFELLNRHLSRVVAICDQYGLQPMMWSDMFFRLGSKTNDYYDMNACVPDEVIARMPQVGMVYWDYYHRDAEVYEHMLTAHERMQREVIFAGGVWTWSGFLPHVKQTESTMRVGLKVCAKHQVKTVLATLWGDDGAETNLMLGNSLLPIFSEACWQGPECDETEMVLAGECLTGLPRSVVEAWGEFFVISKDYHYCPGKMLVWGDPLYPLFFYYGDDNRQQLVERSQRALAALTPFREERLECRYAALLFEICLAKCDLIHQLRDRYLAKDRAWLADLAERKIPELIVTYEALHKAHQQLWEQDNRRFGWEVISLRYAGTVGRLRDAQDVITRWLAGELDAIEELEAEPRGLIKAGRPHVYGYMATPARDFWSMG